MTFKNPWITAGMSEVPLELARALAYIGSGGMEGIASPGDLKVTQTPTASSTLRIAAGVFSTTSRFPNQANQSYIGYNDAEVTVTVPANNTAGTRYYLVYAHVTDPGQSGQPGPLAVPVDIRIIADVSSTATSLSDVPAYSQQSGYALARLAVPANTSNITDAMIRGTGAADLRTLVNQRRYDELRIVSLATGSTAQNLTSTSFALWPSQATWPITVPKWARKVQIVGHIAGYKMIEAATSGANFNGQLRVEFGSLVGSSTIYDYSLPAGLGQADAGATMVAAEFTISLALRGTTQTMRLTGLRTSGTTGANLRAQSGTSVVFRAVFTEEIE